MVVKSIFLILNISHSSFASNHNISDPPAGRGRGEGGPTWPLVTPGPSLVTAQHRPCHQENKSQQHYPNWQIQPCCNYYVDHYIRLKKGYNKWIHYAPPWQKLDLNRCYKTRSVIKTLFRQITIAVALIFTCLRGAICSNLRVWPPSSLLHVMTICSDQGRVLPGGAQPILICYWHNFSVSHFTTNQAALAGPSRDPSYPHNVSHYPVLIFEMNYVRAAHYIKWNENYVNC